MSRLYHNDIYLWSFLFSCTAISMLPMIKDKLPLMPTILIMLIGDPGVASQEANADFREEQISLSIIQYTTVNN